MTEIKELKQEVENSKVFRNWQSQHKKAYFYMLFSMFDSKPELEFSYYEPDSKTVTTFTINKSVGLKSTEAVEWEEKPKEPKLEQVNVGFDEALKKGLELQEKYYTEEGPIKKIVILQFLDERIIWNITFLTLSFSTLNIKLDASTGSVISHSLRKLFDFA